MPNNDDDSEWSEDAIPAVEILNYDLNNIGLKNLLSDNVVPASNNPQADASDYSSSNSSQHSEESENPATNDLRIKPTGVLLEKEAEISGKIRYKIGHLPPPDNDPNEKPVIYDDHNHFLKHAAVKAKVVRSNSIRNMLIDPDDVEDDRRQASARFSIEPFSNSSNSALIPSKLSMKDLEDELTDSSEDEIPAREILNYDLNNAGLVNLSGSSSEGAKPPELENSFSKVSAGDDKAAAMEKFPGNDSDAIVGSDGSDEEIPAVEILNYDLTNIGLKSIQQDSSSHVDATSSELTPQANLKNPLSAIEVDSQRETESTSSRSLGTSSESSDSDSLSVSSCDEITAVEILNYDLNNAGLKMLHENRDDSHDDFESKPLISEQTGAISPVIDQRPKQISDDSSVLSADSIPAVEILNYDLSNAGLKKLHENIPEDDGKIMPGVTHASDKDRQVNGTNSEEQEIGVEKGKTAKPQIAKNADIGEIKSLPLPPSKPQLLDTDSVDSVEEETPAVEILNYDMVNVGLRNSSGSHAPSKTEEKTKGDKLLDIGKPNPSIGAEDCSSQHSKSPSHDFHDHGHFLSIAAEKESSEQKRLANEQGLAFRKSPLLAAHSVTDSNRIDSNRIEMNRSKNQHVSGTSISNINPCSQERNIVYTIAPVESHTTTTVVTSTKTFVEPDGTSVTTTTITTRTYTTPCLPEQQLFLTKRDACGSQETKQNNFGTGGPDSKIYEKFASRDSQQGVEPEKLAQDLSVIALESFGGHQSGGNKTSVNASEVDSDNVDLSGENHVFESDCVSKRLTRENANQELSDRSLKLEVKPPTRREIDGSSNCSAESASDVEDNEGNAFAVESNPGVETNSTRGSICSSPVSASEPSVVSINKGEIEKSSESIGLGNLKKLVDSAENKSKPEKSHAGHDLDDSGTGDNSPFSIKRNKFEDHVEFLNDAASLRSEVDDESLAEEEKRNDEIAKKKILSFGLSFEDSSCVSPLPSPGSARSHSQPLLKSAPVSTNSLVSRSSKPSEKDTVDGSEFSDDSEWSDEIPAKEILNYDLNNVGLKDLR